MRIRAATLAVLAIGLALAAPASSRASDVDYASRLESLAGGRSLADGWRVVDPARAPMRFSLVGLHWQGAGEVEVRTRLGSGAWGHWQDADADEGVSEGVSPDGWRLGSPLWVRDADTVQFRLRGPVARLRAHYVRSPVEPLAGRRLSVAGSPEVISRAGWGADETIVRTEPGYAPRLGYAIVHHTAGESPETPEESAAIVRAIEVYHVKGNGWNDIGYNALIDRFGQIFEGRGGGLDRNVIGAHVKGFNTGAVGVALLGNYDRDVLTPEARAALVRFLAWRLDVAHVDPVSLLAVVSGGNNANPAGAQLTIRAISGHRDFDLTACPGANLYAELSSIGAEVGATGGPKLFDPAAAPAAVAVGADGTPTPIRLTARLSEARSWSITVSDAAGAVLATGSGGGDAIDWTWDGRDGAGRAVDASRRPVAVLSAGAEVRPATVALTAVDRSAAPVQPVVAVSGLRVSPAVLTANGDGSGDRATISFGVTAAATVTVRIRDEQGVPVATLLDAVGVGPGRQSFAWDGRAADGAVAPDGRYRVEVVARGADGIPVTGSVRLTLDRSLVGVGTAALVSPNGDGRLDRLPVTFTLGRPATVAVRVRRGTSWVGTVFRGELAAGQQSLAWVPRTRKGRLADGRYAVVVRSTTDLGTQSQQRAFTVDATPPRLRVVSAWSRRSSTKIVLRVSEDARIRARLDAGLPLSIDRSRGRVVIWVRAHADRVRIVAVDAAGNRSAPVRRALRAPGR
ncbi:MAG: FlgD immunoglobulin-like domain containing protein [Thermoleophilia bacterium]